MDQREQVAPMTQTARYAERAGALHAAGRTYSEIAQELGVTLSRARVLVTGSVTRRVDLEIDRALDLARLEHLYGVAARAAEHARNARETAQAISAAVRVLERRAKLLGLDQPARVEIDHRVRALAVSLGLDPATALAEARALLADADEVLDLPAEPLLPCYDALSD